MSGPVASYNSSNNSIQLTFPLVGACRHRLVGLLGVAVYLACQPESLAALRGAPLSLLLALALRINRQGTCYPGLKTLCKDTGYGKTTVLKGLDTLEEIGLVRRTRRAHTSSLYALTLPQQDPPTLTKDASGSENEPKPEPSQAKAPENEPKQESVVVKDINPEIKHPQTVSVQKTDHPAQQWTFEADWLPLLEDLKEEGVYPSIAEQALRAVQARGGTPEDVQRWIGYYRERVRKGAVRSVGFLVSALRNGWALPEVPKPDGVEDRRRYITGKYAKYIKW